MHKIIIILSILLSACSNAESDAKQAVLSQLKDPNSAKFGKFTLVNKYGACLTVNARNSMGGYTGVKQAMLVKSAKFGSEEWQVVDFSELSHPKCIYAIKQVDFSNFSE